MAYFDFSNISKSPYFQSKKLDSALDKKGKNLQF